MPDTVEDQIVSRGALAAFSEQAMGLILSWSWWSVAECMSFAFARSNPASIGRFPAFSYRSLNYNPRTHSKEPRMDVDDHEEPVVYKVVVNDEEQYSVWPADKKNPLGWRDAGKTGSKAECLAHIGEVWTDMRPLSLRSTHTE